VKIAREIPQGTKREQVKQGSNASYWLRRIDRTPPRNSLIFWRSSQLSALSSQPLRRQASAHSGSRRMTWSRQTYLLRHAERSRTSGGAKHLSLDVSRASALRNPSRHPRSLRSLPPLNCAALRDDDGLQVTCPHSLAHRPDRFAGCAAPAPASQETRRVVRSGTSMLPRRNYPSGDSRARARSSRASIW
jgi:hypothetical protein